MYALEELYTANKDKDVSGYTDSSVQAWKDALAAAEEVLNDPSASTDEVQNAYDQLSTALDGLKVKDEGTTNPSDPDTGKDPEKPGQDQPDGSGDRPDNQPGGGNAPSSQKPEADGSVPQRSDCGSYLPRQRRLRSCSQEGTEKGQNRTN